MKSLQQVDQDAAEFILQNLPDDLVWLETEWEQVIHTGTSQDRILEDLARTLLILRKIKVNEKIKSLYLLQQQTDENEAAADLELQKELLDAIKTRGLVEKAQSIPLISD